MALRANWGTKLCPIRGSGLEETALSLKAPSDIAGNGPPGIQDVEGGGRGGVRGG